ncbi:hypothetical protein BDI4_280003 [Burkholderia diffusa]|nr:hypothetical protein BDI4_280003 [Burkholderia diffusa]
MRRRAVSGGQAAAARMAGAMAGAAVRPRHRSTRGRYLASRHRYGVTAWRGLHRGPHFWQHRPVFASSSRAAIRARFSRRVHGRGDRRSGTRRRPTGFPNGRAVCRVPGSFLHRRHPPCRSPPPT